MVLPFGVRIFQTVFDRGRLEKIVKKKKKKKERKKKKKPGHVGKPLDSFKTTRKETTKQNKKVLSKKKGSYAVRHYFDSRRSNRQDEWTVFTHENKTQTVISKA